MRLFLVAINKGPQALLGLLFLGIAFWAGMANAKTCPSTLQSNLHEIGDLSVGGEFRFWYYYVDQYDYETRDRLNTSYTYFSGRGMAEYALSDSLVAGVEALLRNTEEDEDDFVCEWCSDGWRLNVRQAWLDYAPEAFTLHLGRDLLASGNSMVLDNFFDQATVEFDIGDLTVWTGGGVLANDVAREASSCQRGAVFEYYPYWKQTMNSDWGDHRLGFIETSVSLLPKQYQQALLLYTDSAVDDEQDSWIGDLYFNGTIPGGIKYFAEGALQYYPESTNAYAGASLILSKGLSFSMLRQQVQAGLLVAQRDEKQGFAPLYESLWIGERYRYSLYAGDIFYLKQTLRWDKLKPVSLMTQYSQKFSGSTNDELDLGVQLAFAEKYRFSVIYSALNLSGDYELTHQVQFTTRLNL